MIHIKNTLEEDGFCLIPNAFSVSYTSELVHAVQNILKKKYFLYDILKIKELNQIYKIKYMFEKSEIFFKTLVSDPILAIILDIIEDPNSVVPTWEDLLIKAPSNGIPVTVHQDLDLVSTLDNVYIIGIYLHDSHHNPVEYLPGSHKLGPLTADELSRVYNMNKNSFIPLNAKAGDISVHNAKVIHFSGKNKNPNVRYTWYLEFRTKDQLINFSPWDDKWIASRRAIWVSALKKYKDNIDNLIPDYEELRSYMNPLNLRVPHKNDKINFDLNSPYNHFQRAPSLEDVY